MKATKRRTHKAPTMSAEDAKRFGRVSYANAAWVMHNLHCDCNPYEDVFTYNRWKAQGYQVRRGEHGIKLAIVHEVSREERDGTTTTRKIFASATVFCKCQVDKVGASAPASAPKLATITKADSKYATAAQSQEFHKRELTRKPIVLVESSGEPITTVEENGPCGFPQHEQVMTGEGYHKRKMPKVALRYHYKGTRDGMAYDFHSCEDCAAKIFKGAAVSHTTIPRADAIIDETYLKQVREDIAGGHADMSDWVTRNLVKWSDFEPTMTIAYNGREIASVNGNYKRGMVKEAVQLALAK